MTFKQVLNAEQEHDYNAEQVKRACRAAIQRSQAGSQRAMALEVTQYLIDTYCLGLCLDKDSIV